MSRGRIFLDVYGNKTHGLSIFTDTVSAVLQRFCRWGPERITFIDIPGKDERTEGPDFRASVTVCLLVRDFLSVFNFDQEEEGTLSFTY